MEINKAKSILREWVDSDRTMRNNSLESDFDKFCEERNEAIDEVLEELDWVTQEKEEWRLICEMQSQREYKSKFLKEFQEENGKNCFPDYDEIYKRYDTQKDTIGKMLKDLDKKEKIINAMAGDLNDYDGDGLCFYYTESTKTWGPDRIPTCGLNKSSHCIECIKQYYEKKVSEDDKT